MLPLLFVFAASDVSQNIYKIFHGNWFISSEILNENETVVRNYYLSLESSNNKTREIDFKLKKNNITSKFMSKFHVNFQSNGQFHIQGIDSNNELIDSIFVDLCYNVYPHASATGKWADYIYNLDVITTTTMQLTLIEPSTSQMIVFNFKKDYTPLPLIKAILPIIYFIVLFGVSQGVSKLTIRKFEKQRQNAKQNQTSKTPSNTPKKEKTPSNTPKKEKTN